MPITSTVAWNGSATSRNGLTWAIERETSHGGGVLLLAVIDARLKPFGPAGIDELTDAAERALDAEVAWARQAHPDLSFESRIVVDDREHALIEQCPPGSVVVLGVEERPARVKRWSLTARVAANAQNPVAVVPAAAETGRSGVVVGTDGSDDSHAALRLAADEARHRGESLHVVHVWPTTGAPSDAIRPAFEADAREHERALHGWVEQLRDEFPSIAIHGHLDPGPPVAALTRRASNASLLVVGSRGIGAARRLVLGSVSRSVVLGAARCPVIVAKA